MSKRLKQVLDLLAEGHTAESVANQLGISHSTVNHHKQRLFEKAKATNVIEMLRYFYEFVPKDRP